MVLLAISPGLSSAIENYNHALPENEAQIKDAAIGQPISHEQVIHISRTLRHTSANPSYHLPDLLRGVTIYVEPPKPKPQQTDAYKALMARLRREAEDRAYAAMTAQSQSQTNGTAGPFSTASIGTDARNAVDDDEEMTYSDVSRQLTLILNVLVSIIFCAVSIWLAAWHWATPTRLFASMAGAIVVGVAEVVIYAGYIRRLREARTKERRKPETKRITETWATAGRSVGVGVGDGDGVGVDGSSKASGARKHVSSTDQHHVRLRTLKA